MSPPHPPAQPSPSGPQGDPMCCLLLLQGKSWALCYRTLGPGGQDSVPSVSPALGSVSLYQLLSHRLFVSSIWSINKAALTHSCEAWVGRAEIRGCSDAGARWAGGGAGAGAGADGFPVLGGAVLVPVPLRWLPVPGARWGGAVAVSPRYPVGCWRCWYRCLPGTRRAVGGAVVPPVSPGRCPRAGPAEAACPGPPAPLAPAVTCRAAAGLPLLPPSLRASLPRPGSALGAAAIAP